MSLIVPPDIQMLVTPERMKLAKVVVGESCKRAPVEVPGVICQRTDDKFIPFAKAVSGRRSEGAGRIPRRLAGILISAMWSVAARFGYPYCPSGNDRNSAATV